MPITEEQFENELRAASARTQADFYGAAREIKSKQARHYTRLARHRGGSSKAAEAPAKYGKTA